MATPDYGTPVIDRTDAERIWDAARKEMRLEYQNRLSVRLAEDRVRIADGVIAWIDENPVSKKLTNAQKAALKKIVQADPEPAEPTPAREPGDPTPPQ